MNILLVFLFIGFIFAIGWIINGFLENKRIKQENIASTYNHEVPFSLFYLISSFIWKPIVSMMISVLIGGIIAMGIGKFFDQKPVPGKIVNIYSIDDVIGSEGGIFIGYAQEGTYFYYYKTSRGYKMGKLNADECTIVEDDNETPRIQYYNSDFVNPKHESWAIAVDEYDVEIIVPEKSIKQDYNFDLN